MRYNTGRASHQISAADRFAFGNAHYRDTPTIKQKKYWSYLMKLCDEHNISLQGLLIKLETRQDYSRGIDMVTNRLMKAGVMDRQPCVDAYKKNGQERYKAFLEERRNTSWISLKAKKPDRKFVKTLDADGNMWTLEWNDKYKVFVSPVGKAITRKNEAVHKYKVPIAWAYLED